jgi:hypothetical protein
VWKFRGERRLWCAHEKGRTFPVDLARQPVEERPVEANYHVPRVVDGEAEDDIGTALERLVRDGARRMLERA